MVAAAAVLALGADTVPGWPMTLAAWPAREYPFRM
jgi:hypothetical protein